MAKVLLLEDDVDLANKLVHFLAAKGHIVESVSSGSDAWLRLTSYGYDALIFDWNVPDLQGNELCRKYRNQGGVLPILMITGRTAESDLESAFASGVDDYLKKPFSPQELLCRLLAVLRRQPKAESQISHLGNLTFHHQSRELFIENKSVSLQPQESAILEYLLKQRSCVNPIELVERVGDANTTIEAIRTSIMHLRKKLATNGSTAMIDTSRGEGYAVVYDKPSE